MRTRLKLGLMKKLGRHLEIPKHGDGAPGDSAALVRGRRPSIAPVPAMFGQDDSSSEDEEEDSCSSEKDKEKEQEEKEKEDEHRKEEDEEKYLDIQWVTPAENCE